MQAISTSTLSEESTLKVPKGRGSMDKIVPHLWFDTEAGEAVDFYISLFDDSERIVTQELEGTPSGEDTNVYEFKLAGQYMGAVNGGPHFKMNPSISMMVLCDTEEEIQTLWDKLIEDGKELMPLQSYDFSELYGWVEDKYGFSWQLISSEGMDYKQKLIPSLLFSVHATVKARDAMTNNTKLFKNVNELEVFKYENEQKNHPKAELAHATFEIMDMELVAADNSEEVDYTFNEAISLMVRCVTQAEIDYYWDKLSAVPEAEQCGWLKDKFSVSWQIVPVVLPELLSNPDPEKAKKATEAMLQMKKIEIEELKNLK